MNFSRFQAHSYAVIGIACAALASAQSAPQIVKGVVKSVGNNVVTLTGPQGDVKISLSPEWKISVSTPAKLSDVKPGSFIGTTNVDVPGGGRSTEIHVFPPGTPPDTGHQSTIDAKSGSKMTNGTVGKFVGSNGGVEMDIAFPGGTRHVKVPPDALITTVTPADRSLLKPGITVTISIFATPDGTNLGRFISTGPNGGPPAR